jgi:hypothetical protein
VQDYRIRLVRDTSSLHRAKSRAEAIEPAAPGKTLNMLVDRARARKAPVLSKTAKEGQ